MSNNEMNASKKLAIGAAVLVAVVLLGGAVLESFPATHVAYQQAATMLTGGAVSASSTASAQVPVIKPVTHISTPDSVRAVYMTACIAGSPSLRADLLETIAGTKINSLVVDIKDYTGTLAYSQTKVPNPHGYGCRIHDLPGFIALLHEKGIYAIARITVFQDPLYASTHPELAIGSDSRPGSPWLDKNDLAFIDPDFATYWDYIVAIAKEAHDIGFDEVNFDYIRFPSDGDMNDADFAIPPGSTRALVMEDFFAYLRSELEPTGVVMSADIFGQTVVNRDDMGIGQIFEKVLPYFDYVSPMVYPSHFINGFMGFANPAAEPYEVVHSTMVSAVERAVVVEMSPKKIRPWLQAFDLGAVYTPDMVKSQIQAVRDAGLDGWMLWDAANRYNRESL